MQLFALIGTIAGATSILAWMFPDRPWVVFAGGMVFACSDSIAGQSLIAGSEMPALALAVFAGFAMILPCALHLATNLLVHGNATNRSFAFKGSSLERIPDALSATAFVLLPLRLASWPAGAALLAALIAAAIAHRRAWARHASTAFLKVAGLFAALNLVFLLFSMSFIDHWTNFDPRIMLPCLASVILALVILVVRGIINGSRLAWGATALLLVPLAFGARRTIWMVGQCYASGIEHRRIDLTHSGLAEVMEREAGPATVLMTNNPAMLWSLTQRDADAYPARFDPTTNRENAALAEDVRRAQERLASAPAGLLVTLPTPDNESRLPATELLGPVPAMVVFRSDGIIVHRVARE